MYEIRIKWVGKEESEFQLARKIGYSELPIFWIIKELSSGETETVEYPLYNIEKISVITRNVSPYKITRST